MSFCAHVVLYLDEYSLFTAADAFATASGSPLRRSCSSFGMLFGDYRHIHTRATTSAYNDSIEKMVKAGIAENVIIEMVRNKPCDKISTTDRLIEMRNAREFLNCPLAMIAKKEAIRALQKEESGSPPSRCRRASLPTGKSRASGDTTGQTDERVKNSCGWSRHAHPNCCLVRHR